MVNMHYDSESFGSITSVDELSNTMKKLQCRGALLLFVFVLFLPLIVLLPREIAEVLLFPGLVATVVISLVGVFLLATSLSRRYYINGIKILQHIAPPDPVITKAYAVTKRENTIIFILRSAPYALYFVSFKESELTPATEIDVPKTFWKWNSALHIEGLRVHNRKGSFSVPIPERGFIRGEGILLVLPIRGQSYIIHVPDFSRNHLLAVAEYADLLTSAGASIDE